MKVLVTGGAGFIGSNLVDELIVKGHDVVVIDNLTSGSAENLNPKAKFYLLDAQDPKLMDILADEQSEIIYHLAAQISVQKSLDDPALDAQVNILGTVNLLQAARKTRVKKLIYASSAAVYGEPQYLALTEDHPTFPVSFYGLSKLGAERYIQLFSALHNLDYTILRYGNVYGIRQDKQGESGVISIFLSNLLNQQECVIFGDGQAARDYVYVGDVVSANLHAMEKGSKEIINIGTGIPVTTNELYSIMSKLLNIQKQPIYKKERPGDISRSYYSIAKCQEIFRWIPQYPLEQGLRNTIQYLQNSN